MKNIPVIVYYLIDLMKQKLFESLSKLKPQKLYINQDGPRKNFLKIWKCKKSETALTQIGTVMFFLISMKIIRVVGSQ